MIKKVVHLTSAHSRSDTRIFLKECSSLSKAGYEVTLIVADGKGDEIKNDIRIVDVNKDGNQSKLKRILKLPKLVYQAALIADGDVYHFHDPELISVGIKLKKAGRKVIYDIHEDLPRQALAKEYIPKFLRVPLAAMIEFYEIRSAKKFNALITATPFINERFVKLSPNSVNINNFPIIGELAMSEAGKEKENALCFVGGIDGQRGIKQLIKAIDLCKVKLYLVGTFSGHEFKNELKGLPGWKNVIECGQLNRKEVAEVMAKSICGAVTFLPIPNHCNALPNKMFEYMSASLPVLCSDFSLWKDIIEGNECGVCVDSENPEAIAEGIKKIVDDIDGIRQMGQNGYEAIIQKYNWDKESIKLLDLYNNLD